MIRERLKWKPHKSLSTDAKHRGGTVRSSAELSVMERERRNGVTYVGNKDQLIFLEYGINVKGFFKKN